MSEPKHISEILREIAQNPQDEMSKVLQQLPCIQSLLKSPSFGEVGKASISDWLDSQDVMQALHISPRTLQTLRSNGTLPYSRIGNKIYYLKQDIIKILSDNYTLNQIRNYGK
jgi:hypothetical protein